MTITPEDLKRQNDAWEREIDHVTDILLLFRTETDPVRRELFWQTYMTARARMNVEAARLSALIEQMQIEQKERSMRTRIAHAASVVVLSLLLIAGISVRAQDGLETNTPQIVEGTTTLVSGEPIPTAVPAVGTEEAPVSNPEQPAPSPSGDSSLIELVKVAMPWLGAILIIAVIVLGMLGREFIINLGKSTPAYVREPIFSGAETGLAKLEEYTHTTETTIDDAAAAELKKFLLGIIGEIRAEEKVQAAKLASSATPSGDPMLGSAWQPQYPVDGQPQS
jgi:hypothetical protein